MGWSVGFKSFLIVVAKKDKVHAAKGLPLLHVLVEDDRDLLGDVSEMAVCEERELIDENVLKGHVVVHQEGDKVHGLVGAFQGDLELATQGHGFVVGVPTSMAAPMMYVHVAHIAP